jgi:Cu-Zn family superoxide dismutase
MLRRKFRSVFMARFAAFAAPLIALAVSGCAAGTSLLEPPPQEPALAPIAGATTVPIKALDGREIGLLTLAEGANGVVIRVNILPNGLQPGWHGLHFHEKGDCGGESFAAAGSHVGHGERTSHGLLNSEGPEPGDLPNLLVPLGQRPTVVELYSPGVTLDDGRGRARLRDADGSSFMIHANADDHTSQPIGGAGGRIACAVIPPDPEAARPASPPARRARRQP